MWSLPSFPGFRHPLEAGRTDHGSPRVQNKWLSCGFWTLACEEPQIPLYLTVAQPLPTLSSKPLASGWGCCPTPPCRSPRASSRVNPTSILYPPVFHFRGPGVCLPLLFPKTGSNSCPKWTFWAQWAVDTFPAYKDSSPGVHKTPTTIRLCLRSMGDKLQDAQEHPRGAFKETDSERIRAARGQRLVQRDLACHLLSTHPWLYLFLWL